MMSCILKGFNDANEGSDDCVCSSDDELTNRHRGIAFCRFLSKR